MRRLTIGRGRAKERPGELPEEPHPSLSNFFFSPTLSLSPVSTPSAPPLLASFILSSPRSPRTPTAAANKSRAGWEERAREESRGKARGGRRRKGDLFSPPLFFFLLVSLFIFLLPLRLLGFGGVGGWLVGWWLRESEG